MRKEISRQHNDYNEMFISMLFTRDDDYYDNMIGSYECLQFGKYNHLIGGDYMMQVIGETSDIRLFI